MALTRERKEELVALYSELLGQATGIVMVETRNLSVAQVNGLRDKLREVEGTYVITKNTLFGIALKNAGWPVPENLLAGPTAVIFGAANFPAVAKVALGFTKDFENLYSIKGGIMAGQVLTSKQVDAVSSLPTLPELRAQLAGLIAQPAAGIVGVLNGAVAGVAQVLQAYVSKQEAA